MEYSRRLELIPEIIGWQASFMGFLSPRAIENMGAVELGDRELAEFRLDDKARVFRKIHHV